MGALLMSSGIALMAAPMSADATASTGGNVVLKQKPPKHLKDWVCKYVGTPGVDERLKQGNDGLVWVDTNASEHSWFNDAHGRSFVLYKNVAHDPRPSASECPTPDNEQGLATASVTFIDPNCDNDNTASYETSGEHVVFKVVSGDEGGGQNLTASSPVTVSPGSYIKIVAFALPHYKFENGKKWMVFEHTFGDAVINCTEVTPAAPTYVEPTCTTLPSVTTPTSELVTYVVTGNKVAGGTVHIEATLVNSETSHFAEGATTTWDHTFTVPTGCTAVSPPSVAPTTTVNPPKTHVKTHVKAQTTTTPTVVSAGLASTTSSTQAGLGLTAAGLVLLAGAGGLVLEEGRRKQTA
ncbi:MAG TPA: hypothetical protein VHO29_00405 [Marmoricola sp.]|nr:hypothetical protein [Marmoricola sp.]